MNTIKTENHKHCVCCGEVVEFTASTECKSPNNTTKSDTSGKKHHVTLA